VHTHTTRTIPYSRKERTKGVSTKALRTVFILGSLIAGSMGVISAPQMIGPAYAQSDQASERACPIPGYTLSRGECTANPTIEFKCEPSTLAGVPVVRSGEICRATGPANVITGGVCDSVEGDRVVTGGRNPQATCSFAATEVISCPGGVTPTEEGKCITRPGQGNNPTV
jgi:hypothetical protein